MNYQSGALKDVAQQNPVCETVEMTSLLDHFFCFNELSKRSFEGCCEAKSY
jgi:hypothetical protein